VCKGGDLIITPLRGENVILTGTVVVLCLPLSGAGAAADVAKGAKPVGNVFYTGGKEAQAAATEFATQNGGRTIGQTAMGRALDGLTPHMDWLTEARPLWVKASAKFADDAAKTQDVVHVFIDIRAASTSGIWSTTEAPILLKNGVNLMYHYVP
jgi:hypothetical protein